MFLDTQFATLQSQEDEEGGILGAARWLVICILFVVLAAVSALAGIS
jgi:hypothetical protein